MPSVDEYFISNNFQIVAIKNSAIMDIFVRFINNNIKQ